MRDAPTVCRPDFLRVAARSDPAHVASAIAHELRTCGHCTAQAISNEAIGRMGTAAALATQWLAACGKTVTTTPKLITVEFDQDFRWAVRFEMTVEG
jgi:stage V sporulation protein SpoVS